MVGKGWRDSNYLSSYRLRIYRCQRTLHRWTDLRQESYELVDHAHTHDGTHSLPIGRQGNCVPLEPVTVVNPAI